MATVDRIRVYPVKALEGVDIDEVEVLDGGTLALDREFAMFDDDRNVVNARHTGRVNELSTAFDPDSETLQVETPEGESRTFDLYEERGRAEAWLADFFETELTLRRDESLGFVDRPSHGPSVISTATIREVASWFDDLSVGNVRRRCRANLELSGVPAFWEDRFVGEDAPDLAIGGLRLRGVKHCVRCITPQRDPDTGEPHPEFRDRFFEQRMETLPEWADEDDFESIYSVMLITDIAASDHPRSISVGDPARVVEQDAKLPGPLEE